MTPSSEWSALSWADQHDEWTEDRRYLGLDVLTRYGIRRRSPDQRHQRGGDRPADHPGAPSRTGFSGGLIRPKE
jgi:hypothetical protein